MIEAKIIADSTTKEGKRITTMQVKFHRFILPEFNTHRVFSRNFSSSRAIPTAKLLEQVKKDPAMPVHWGKNQPGMQANEELDQLQKEAVRMAWVAGAQEAAARANVIAQQGAHKQIVNRLIEPFLWANGIVTSTEWDNWFELRAHEDAQPEIHELALRMREAMEGSTPQVLEHGQWHLPYILDHERDDAHFHKKENKDLLIKISAARCCRVSYLKHDGNIPNIDEDLALFDRLAGAVPLHASPLEHQATPFPDEIHVDGALSGNFKGWIQYRKIWEKQIYSKQGN